MTMKLFDNTRVPLLEQALDVYALRTRVSASNIANINTPGYTAKRVEFEEEFSKALQQNQGRAGITMTHKNHIPIHNGQAAVVRIGGIGDASGQSLNSDELASGVNNVDIDHEMAELAKNQIRFKFASQMVSGQFKGLQKSIRGQL
jgi:flagellar basal-body rod protein FlgB